MSSVAFHTLGDVRRIGGAERALAGARCERLFWSALAIDSFSVRDDDGAYQRLMRMLPPTHYLRSINVTGPHETVESLRTALSGFSGCLAWKGEEINPFELQLNTAIAIGNDAIIFSARMHGQCEIHAFVEGQNRTWLADIIDRGLACDVLRVPRQTQYNTWEQVAAMLRADTSEPVVMSYSVTESFPDAGLALADKRPPEDWKTWTAEQRHAWGAAREEFYELPREEQWSRSVAALRAKSANVKLELRPDDWDTFRFSDGITAFDIVAPDYSDRLDRKLGIAPGDEP